MLFFRVILVSILLDQRLSFQRDYSALWVAEWKRRSFREQGITLKTSAPGKPFGSRNGIRVGLKFRTWNSCQLTQERPLKNSVEASPDIVFILSPRYFLVISLGFHLMHVTSINRLKGQWTESQKTEIGFIKIIERSLLYLLQRNLGYKWDIH